MSMTITKVHGLDVADREELVLDMTGDGSYVTGGYDLTPADLPMRCGIEIDHVEGKAPSGRSLRYDKANAKVLWIEPNGTEVANATDLSGETARARLLGR